MIKNMFDCENDAILRTADLMALAAITAPKASGKDSIESCVITGEDKDRLAEKMRELGKTTGIVIFDRDASNVDASTAVVLIGCKDKPYGMPGCAANGIGMCGFENCGKMKQAGSNCVFNTTDLGVAVGSAVSIAADSRVDNRVMWTIGRAALKLGFLSDDCRSLIWGIPLSASNKSIFFDRNAGAVLLK